MAGALQVRNGTKMNMAFDVPLGEETIFEYICTFARAIDESAFLVSVPMKGGKPLELDFTRKLLFRYNQGTEQVIVAGYADDEVREGIRRYWKIRRVMDQRQYFQRADQRYKVALRIEYMQDEWPVNADGVIEREEGMSLDISGGGVAMYMARVFEVGETVFLKMPRIGTNPEGNLKDEIPGVVCWMRDAPKGSVYRHVCGFQFRFGNDAQKRELTDYIAYVKQRYRL